MPSTTWNFGDGRGRRPSHRHPNGGGLVDNTAVVDDTAIIGPNSHVGRHAIIGPGVIIGPGAVIGPGVNIKAYSIVGQNVRVKTGVIVGYDGVIRLGSTVDADSTIEPEVRLPVPKIKNIDAAILAEILANSPHGLQMDVYHTCETCHCRAGWAIHIGGHYGYALATAYGSWIAGALIYQANRPGVPIPDFYGGNDAAMADLEECAARQTSTEMFPELNGRG